MGTVECFVCKAERKKHYTFQIDDSRVGHTINCPFCLCQFVLVKRSGKLFLDYPNIAEEETVDSSNFDNLGMGDKSL